MTPAMPTAPSREVIALANAVVHLKPSEMIIGEYIRLLRLHIAKGKRQDALSSTHHHLDRTSYWRAECERLKAAAKQTEAETITLRLEIDALNAKLEAAKLAAPSKKRKKQDTDVIPYPRSPKRAKHDTSSGLSSTLAFDETTEAVLSEGGAVGITLLRTLYHLHTTLKRKGDADPSTLSYYIIEATSNLTEIVLKEARQFAAEPCQYVDELKTALTLCRRATASILVAFNRVEKPEQDSGAHGQAAYAIIHMFREFLGVFATLSDAEALKAIAADSSVSTSSAKAKPKPPRVINIKDLPSMSLFTNFLEGIVNTLDPNIHSHKSLFEGFAFCVLTTLGGRLHQTVFGHVRAQTMEEEIMKSNAVDEIEDDSPSASLPSQDREQKQIRLEGPYLIHLLNHIMKAAPSYLGLIPPTNGRANVPTASGLKRGTLTVEAKTCLQRTLVNCIFGTEGVDESDPLAHCLKMPVKPAPSITMPKIKETEVQDWFKGEMWRLLAWDILSKEGEW